MPATPLVTLHQTLHQTHMTSANPSACLHKLTSTHQPRTLASRGGNVQTHTRAHLHCMPWTLLVVMQHAHGHELAGHARQQPHTALPVFLRTVLLFFPTQHLDVPQVRRGADEDLEGQLNARCARRSCSQSLLCSVFVLHGSSILSSVLALHGGARGGTAAG
eukprot:1158108-Pelagomonas_calceolata.AAC.11